MMSMNGVLRIRVCAALTAVYVFAYVLPAYALVPNDPLWSDDHGIKMLHLPEAWDITRGSDSVVVAVIDTGVDDRNPDIAPNIWTNPKEKLNGLDNDGNGYVGDIHGWNFVDNNNDTRPHESASSTHVGLNHGTVVAGLIGAVGNNAVGGAGVAWHVKIMPLKILNEQGDGDSDAAVKAIDYAIQKKVDIINLSFVGPTPSLNFIQAIRRAYRAGILVVAAAGNGTEGSRGINLDLEPQYPVCFDDPLKEEDWVVGVAALDQDGLLAPFSNYGARCIDVSAPGFHIPSTVFYDPTKGDAGIFGGSWSGTSIAAPFVTGVAALIKSIQPTWGSDQLRRAILENTDPISGNDKLLAGRGSLNALRAVRYALNGGDGGLPTGVLVSSVQSGKTRLAKIFDPEFHEIRSFPITNVSATAHVTTITADVSGSGVANIISAVPDRKGTMIKVFQRDGTVLRTMRPFGARVRDGLYMSAIDLRRDGIEELLVTPEHSTTSYVINADGTIGPTFTVPDVGVPVRSAALLNEGDPLIVTTAVYPNHVVVYEWNRVGAFVRSFTVPVGGAVSMGVIDRVGNGVEDLYVMSPHGAAVTIAFVSPDGVFKDPVSIPFSGRIVGITAARTTGKDHESILLATQRAKDFSFSTVTDAGKLALANTQHNAPRVSRWDELSFGR